MRSGLCKTQCSTTANASRLSAEQSTTERSLPMTHRRITLIIGGLIGALVLVLVQAL
jgi:hypothetical protein